MADSLNALIAAHCQRAARQMSEFLARDLYRAPVETNTFRRTWWLVPLRKGGRKRGRILRWTWRYRAGWDVKHDIDGFAEVLERGERGGDF